MKLTPRELYQGWAAFLEWGRPQPPDEELLLEEEVYVTQIANGSAGVSAGRPSTGEVTQGEPLIRRPRRRGSECV